MKQATVDVEKKDVKSFLLVCLYNSIHGHFVSRESMSFPTRQLACSVPKHHAMPYHAGDMTNWHQPRLLGKMSSAERKIPNA